MNKIDRLLIEEWQIAFQSGWDAGRRAERLMPKWYRPIPHPDADILCSSNLMSQILSEHRPWNKKISHDTLLRKYPVGNSKPRKPGQSLAEGPVVRGGVNPMPSAPRPLRAPKGQGSSGLSSC